jgi:hypothetical protein
MANTKILYLEANKRNFVSKFLMQNQNYWLRGEDGKIDHNRRMHPDPPWIYTKPRENQNCHFWHKIQFDVLSGQTKIPEPCLDCWKVVLMPRNLEELVATYFMQLQLNRASKCGTEGDRENTDRLYGAYWYNGSVEEGRECHALVKKTMAENKSWKRTMFGTALDVRFYDKGDVMYFAQGEVTVEGPPNLILKRGCTEYEQHIGRSDEWEVSDDQREMDFLSRDAFVQDVPNFRQSDHQLAHVIESWIHNAFRWGDHSYLKFTNNNRLFKPPITYHDQETPEELEPSECGTGPGPFSDTGGFEDGQKCS